MKEKKRHWAKGDVKIAFAIITHKDRNIHTAEKSGY